MFGCHLRQSRVQLTAQRLKLHLLTKRQLSNNMLRQLLPSSKVMVSHRLNNHNKVAGRVPAVNSAVAAGAEGDWESF